MNLGEKLQSLRKEKGLSQEELAEKLNVSRQAVSKWESGIALPEVSKIVELATLFQISINDLLGVETAPAEEETKEEKETKSQNPTVEFPDSFSEKQLSAINQIVAAHTVKKKVSKKAVVFWSIAGALLLVFVWKTVSGRFENLEMRVDTLNNNTNNLSYEVNRIPLRIEEALIEQESPLSDVKMEYRVISSKEAYLDLSMEVKSYVEGMEAQLVIRGEEEEVIPLILDSSYAFTASLDYFRYPKDEALDATLVLSQNGTTTRTPVNLTICSIPFGLTGNGYLSCSYSYSPLRPEDLDFSADFKHSISNSFLYDDGSYFYPVLGEMCLEMKNSRKTRTLFTVDYQSMEFSQKGDTVLNGLVTYGSGDSSVAPAWGIFSYNPESTVSLTQNFSVKIPIISGETYTFYFLVTDNENNLYRIDLEQLVYSDEGFDRGFVPSLAGDQGVLYPVE